MAKATSVRGVKKRSDGRYNVRVTFIDPKSGKERNRVRIVEATSVQDAAKQRIELRERELAARQPRARQRQRLGASAISWLRAKGPSLKASTRAM